MQFSLARLNTSVWPDFQAIYPNITECNYRSFGVHAEIEWWQIMLARWLFFSIFVSSFLCIDWLCDIVIPSVPHSVMERKQRTHYVSHKSMCTMGSAMSNKSTPSTQSKNVAESKSGITSTDFQSLSTDREFSMTSETDEQQNYNDQLLEQLTSPADLDFGDTDGILADLSSSDTNIITYSKNSFT